MERTRISKFIPCSCGIGCLQLHGIELESDPEHAYVHWFNLHTPNINPGGPVSLWERFKYAVKVLFKRDYICDDLTLDHEGVMQLRDACQEALDRWPDEIEAFESAITCGTDCDAMLSAIYQDEEDLRMGRIARLNAEHALTGK